MSNTTNWTLARFCNGNCRDGYLADRQAGLIYGACMEDDGTLISWLDAARTYKWCPACREDVSMRDDSVPMIWQYDVRPNCRSN